MKKTILGLAIISACLCACSSTASEVKASLENTKSTNIASREYVKPMDWYTPRYYDSYTEPQAYSSFLQFDYKNDKDKTELFDYLETIENGKYVSNFPVPLESNTENEIGKYYTSSYYNCCKTEFKRHDLNFRFEIDDPYYKYGMKTDYYGGEIFHLCVTDWYNEPILDKYYKSYSTEEISKEEFDEIEKNSNWHYTGHWTGNFVPDDEYKNYKKFEIVEVFSLCTRMFFSYDEDRNLDKVRIYEGTPYHSSEIKIVGLEK